MTKSIFMLIVLVAYPASAQVISGTIIIINFTKDKIVVSADSLAINHETGLPDYSHCKIATFSHQLIFTNVGSSAFVNSGKILWDNTELARDAVREAHERDHGNINVDTTIDVWAKSVKNHWDLVDRMQASNIAAINNGQLTAGTFIGKGLTTKVAVIGYNVNKLIDPVEIWMSDGNPMTACWPCGQLQGGKICGAGVHLDVAANFCSQRKHGDRINVRTRLQGASESTKLAVKIVEMTIDDYGKTAKDVGGKVDTVSITKDGKITWNSLKKNCRENQD